ncbi:MAG: TIGR00730 family Rossman fold protein [Mogibacterium sp.]|nr:TIGR00730 family Rossman fold protein [Mogibacterium sp.]MBR2540527.1 TIGR00730 family Rossman fold protein [Mogibacterium sp.]
MNITVYCGAHYGRDPEFAERARELGAWMAENGHRLVYGAGDVGTMGVIANAVLDNGGEVVGVTPDFFVFAEEIHDKLTELEVVPDLPERRSRMIQLGEAFIALPGGTGTLDEITEVITLTRLGRLGETIRPVMLYNINGFYDHLLSFFDRVADEEFFGRKDRENIHEVKSIEDIEEILRLAGNPDIERNTLYTANEN